MSDTNGHRERIGNHDARIQYLEDEIDRLRAWRHETVAPMLTIMMYQRTAVPFVFGALGAAAVEIFIRVFLR